MSGFPIPVVEVAVLAPDGKFADFHVTFYGIPIQEFRRPEAVPMLYETFRRRGIGDCLSSPLVLRERFFDPTSAQPRPKDPPPEWTTFKGLNA